MDISSSNSDDDELIFHGRQAQEVWSGSSNKTIPWILEEGMHVNTLGEECNKQQ